MICGLKKYKIDINLFCLIPQKRHAGYKTTIHIGEHIHRILGRARWLSLFAFVLTLAALCSLSKTEHAPKYYIIIKLAH